MNLSNSFRKLVNSCFENIDGVMVEKNLHGYVVFGKQFSTKREVIGAIKTARERLSKSIK